jgi:hypothetical protein
MNVWNKLRALFIKPTPEPEPANITWPEEFERLRQIRAANDPKREILALPVKEM